MECSYYIRNAYCAAFCRRGSTRIRERVGSGYWWWCWQHACVAVAVETIKKIKKMLPGLNSVMKPYLQWIDGELKKQKQESTQAAGEFQVLARQIKGRIRGLMAAGQNQAALGVARQLQPLLPGDEELQKLIAALES